MPWQPHGNCHSASTLPAEAPAWRRPRERAILLARAPTECAVGQNDLERKTGEPGLRSRVIRSLAVGCGVLALAELGLRQVFGYGPEPKLEPHPTIEYLYAPSQETRRFGRRYFINQWSMRSEDVPRHKSRAGECRVLVLGDSVLFGKELDQSQLATVGAELLLSRANAPTRVMNVSAASWGPPNHLAYIQHYGVFDADVAVVVVSSHDYADAPHGQNSRGTPPYLALRELQRQIFARNAPVAPSEPAAPIDIKVATLGFHSLLLALRNQHASPTVLLHPTVAEVQGGPEPGRSVLRAICAQLGVPVRDLTGLVRDSLASGQSPYADSIHLSAAGHRLLATAIVQAVTELPACNGRPEGLSVTE